MNSKPYIILVIFLSCYLPNIQAQTAPRTIEVTGLAEYNLSPNEITIKIEFQEYFIDDIEKPENKVSIETLEKSILKAIYTAGVKKKDISVGGIRVIRPYTKGKHLKRRLSKSFFVCVHNIDEYVDLTKSLETANLFDDIISIFSIEEYKHTEKEIYLTKSRAAAYRNAHEKATLILAESNQKPGKVLQIIEINRSTNQFSPTSYSVENTNASGFKSIIVAYKLKVIFEIL